MNRFDFKHLVVLALAAWLGACADATPAGETQADAAPQDMLPVDRPETGPPPPEEDMGPPVVGARELRVVGDINRLLYFSQTGDFTVEYVGRDVDGQERGIANANVTATLLDEMGQDRTALGLEGTALRSQRRTTDAMGRAKFEVVAGMRDVQGKLRVEAADAAPVQFNITVAREGSGGLRARVIYNPDEGRYDFRVLNEARVDLFDRQNCELLRDTVPNLQGAYFSLPPITPFNEVNNEVAQGDLDDGLTFSVAASVQNAAGNTVAFGCVDGVQIRGGEIVQVDVPVIDLPLQFKGKFTTVNKFDLTGLLRDTGNEALDIVADVLDVLGILGSGNGDRGDAIVHLFCDLVNIDEGICNIVDTIVAPLVDGLIDRFIPPEVLRVLTIISDVLAIVQRFTTIGEIEFTVPGPDQNDLITGTDNRWQQFRFDWREGCDMPPCRRQFTIGNLDQERRPIAGVFESYLETREDPETGDSNLYLVIEPHSLNFRYGIIILGVLEQWVIPAIAGQPGPMTLQDLLSTLLPCADINDFFGDPNSGLCEDILVGALSEIIYDQVSRLDFAPEAFQIRGTAIPLDEDGNLEIDRLTQGKWIGSLRIGDQEFNFNGCFEACRGDEECPAPECEITRE